MTAVCNREHGRLVSMTYSCDHMSCDVHKSDKDIVAAGGLRAMGWETIVNKHYCPEHRRNPLEITPRSTI